MASRALYILVLIVLQVYPNKGCTDFLITRGATADGSTILSYSVDAQWVPGGVKHFPAADHTPGEMRKIIDFETDEYLGEIPEVPHTYRVVGQMNEYQLMIGESTFGGLEALMKPNGIIDYGSLMDILLQRARTPVEAIYMIDKLLKDYGYHSFGESFSIGNQTEVWYMEFIGKGEWGKGAVWVARKIPNGMVSVHSNYARITTFPLDDPDTLFSSDVITFAREHNLYTGSDADFSFSEVYCPVTPTPNWGVYGWQFRFAMTRTWIFYKRVAKLGDADRYVNYVMGKDPTNRIPLWFEPKSQLTAKYVMQLMRDNLEESAFEINTDIGANAYHLPRRFPPQSFKYLGEDYVVDRPIGVEYTAVSYVGQMRENYPDAIGGILWVSMDDTTFSSHIPFYSGSLSVPYGWQYDPKLIMDVDLDHAFWIHNLVANFAYSRYTDLHPEIMAKVDAIDNRYIHESVLVDQTATKLYALDEHKTLEYLTQFTRQKGDELRKEWMEFYKYLFLKYMDGNIKWLNPDNPYVPNVEWKGYPQDWYQRIVTEDGDKYRFPK